MTGNISYENMDSYENPEFLPLENLKLKVKTNGVVETIDALSKKWKNNHYFLHYEAPNIYNDDGIEIQGAKERWVEIVNYMINDLKWLLSLPFYRFWSNIIFNPSILNTLVSFLQEAPPFYALENFPADMLQLLEILSRYVLITFTRLITNKENSKEYMGRPFFGNLLYENYIFTIPIIFDLCQFYGRENPKIMEKILNCLFILEPRYNNDLQKTIPCLIEALEDVERKFDHCSIHTNAAISTNSMKLTLFNLEDMILYILDISSTIEIFLKNYPSAANVFHKEDFMKKLVSTYENTIPEMYKLLDDLAYNDENMPKYMELKHRLDVIRIEILNIFHIIIHEPILNIQENVNTIKEEEIKKQVDEYLDLLSSVISEKEFVTDYDQFYPIKSDLYILSTLCPDPDEINYNYIVQSVNAITGKSNDLLNVFSDINEAVAGPSGISNQMAISENINSSNKKQKPITKNLVELASLVSEVKDILHDLDEYFIEISLKYYNYNTEELINAILEQSLPTELKELKDLGHSQMSASPICTETLNNQNLDCNFETLNMFDNYNNDSNDNNDIKFDNNDIKTQEIINISKDYIIKNYDLVTDVYDDEYDDTYDNRDVRGNTQDDTTEIDRPFTIPRILRDRQKVETVSELISDDDDDDDDDDVRNNQNGKDFVQNPEELRAKAEQRRQMRDSRIAPNVIGNPKGHGQKKDVLYNRQQKNVRKAKYANHNRRSGAQYKRNQGMIPS